MGLFKMSLEKILDKLSKLGFEGADMQFSLDLTASNKWNGRNNTNLHDNDDQEYARVIHILSKAVRLDDNGRLKYGIFGDDITRDKHYALMYNKGAEPKTVDEIVAHYKSFSTKLEYSGGTNLAPAIRACIETVREDWEYTILTIICDGEISPELLEDTKASIVEASNYPISIVIIGVGTADFDQLEKLDSKVKGRKFDNIQFVNGHEYIHKKNAEKKIAEEAFQELPKQYEYIKKHYMTEHYKNTMLAKSFTPPKIFTLDEMIQMYKSKGVEL